MVKPQISEVDIPTIHYTNQQSTTPSNKDPESQMTIPTISHVSLLYPIYKYYDIIIYTNQHGVFPSPFPIRSQFNPIHKWRGTTGYQPTKYLLVICGTENHHFSYCRLNIELAISQMFPYPFSTGKSSVTSWRLHWIIEWFFTCYVWPVRGVPIYIPWCILAYTTILFISILIFSPLLL